MTDGRHEPTSMGQEPRRAVVRCRCGWDTGWITAEGADRVAMRQYAHHYIHPQQRDDRLLRMLDEALAELREP